MKGKKTPKKNQKQTEKIRREKTHKLPNFDSFYDRIGHSPSMNYTSAKLKNAKK